MRRVLHTIGAGSLVFASIGLLGVSTVTSAAQVRPARSAAGVLVDARTSTGVPGSPTGPCGTLPAVSHSYTHVIWVWMENHSYSTIIGSSQAPYINGLASECGLATNYHNISHPSLPNYVAATSGLSLAALSPFTGDCDPSPRAARRPPASSGKARPGGPTKSPCPPTAPCERRGVRGAPRSAALLHVAHRLREFDVPYTQLAPDLAAGTLPAFSFVTPNLIDDMHDGTIGDGRHLALEKPACDLQQRGIQERATCRLRDLGRG